MYSGEGASSQVSLKLCASTRACDYEPGAANQLSADLSDEHSRISGEPSEGDEQVVIDVGDLADGPLETVKVSRSVWPADSITAS